MEKSKVINMRVTPEFKELLERACHVKDMSMTDFLTHAARDKANQVLNGFHQGRGY